MSRRVGPYYRDTARHYAWRARRRAAWGLRWLAGQLDDRRTPDGPTRDDLHAALRRLDSTVTRYMLGDTSGDEVAQAQHLARRLLGMRSHPSADRSDPSGPARPFLVAAIRDAAQRDLRRRALRLIDGPRPHNRGHGASEGDSSL